MATLFAVLIAPILVSALTAALRRWPRAAALAGAGSVALLALFVAVVTPASGEEPLGWELLGRTLSLDAAIGHILTLLYAGTALLLLLAALWPQGRDFTTAAIAALAPLALALMIRPFVYGTVALLAAASIQVGVIQAGRAGSTRAAMHFLTVVVLATPFFLVSGWMLDSEQLVFFRTLWRLLLAGSALLLAGVPFHFWVRPLVEEAAPLAVVAVLGLGQLVTITFVSLVFLENPMFAQTGLPFWLRAAGLATMALAGVLAVTSTQAKRAVAYAALLDMGAVLASMGTGGAGLPVVLLLVLARTLSLALVMAGLAQTGAAEETQQPPAGRLWPVLLAWYGAMSLVGLPLTPGFAGRWAAVGLLGQQSPWFAAVAIAAIAASAVGVWRTLPRPTLPSLAELPERQQVALPQIIAATLLLAAVMFALFPAWPRSLAVSLAALFV
ncbi:MAG: proton-conducting transporter membrane subunit [Anaerolineae bacterium]|nr:proton-conducting transporter membrane subunit [Anaerolineae bacterium]